MFSWSSADDGAEGIQVEAVLLKSQAQTTKNSESKDQGLKLCNFRNKPEGRWYKTIRMLFWQLLLLYCVATFYTSMIFIVSPKRERNALMGSFVNY